MKKYELTAKKFREWIENHGITRTRVAKLLGMNHRTFYNFVVGSREPTLIMAVKIESLTKGNIKPKDWVEFESISLYTPNPNTNDEKHENKETTQESHNLSV